MFSTNTIISAFSGVLILATTAIAGGPDVKISPEKLVPGSAVLVTVTGAEPSTGEFMHMKLHFAKDGDSFMAISGVDLFAKPGTYTLKIEFPSPTTNAAADSQVQVIEKEYPVERFTLKEKVTLTAEELKRVDREKDILDSIWNTESPESLWTPGFIAPVSGRKGSVFGLRRIINNEPRSPHTGADIKADEGTQVLATSSGKIVFAAEQFFSGNSIVLDHGNGIYSMYFHLSKIVTPLGTVVKKGDVIGLVGMTGRASGPHLHWGFRVQGARVDPEAMLGLFK
jgi:murein DD-endopeptidase MepM/ murein hydrolase activator NlpD